MGEVSIIGIGQTDVAEHWDKSVKDLAYEAIKDAVADAKVDHVGALYVGNMIAGEISGQLNLGSQIADFCGYKGIEAYTVEPACVSGGAAIRAGMMAVASGAHDIVVVVGVEKMTDSLSDRVTGALATAADTEYEVDQGATFVAINALLMQRYQYEYQISHDAFAQFSVNSHRNAVHNPHAMSRSAISKDRYLNAPMIPP